MSYIFSSNGNEYTFKKMNNMLINLPNKDGKHVLIRSSNDGNTTYSVYIKCSEYETIGYDERKAFNE